MLIHSLITTSAEESKPGSEGTSRDESKSGTVSSLEFYNELSPLMTTILEDELKNIMIKLWQILPDKVSNGAEKMVLDKFKDTAGDELRNAIGLNVTKRLLNEHNGIIVKIQIHSAATPLDLHNFVKKYRILNFEHVQGVTYAGQLQCWTDLDALFTHKNLKCGYSNVTITPIYNFLECPIILRTVFDGKHNYSDAKQIEIEAAKNMKKRDAKKITDDKVFAEKAEKKTATKYNSYDKGSKYTVAANRSSKDVVSNTIPYNENSKDPFTKIKVRAVAKNTQSTTKDTTEATKNTVVKSAYKTVNNQSGCPNIDEKITTTQSNETKTQTKVTKLDKPKMLESKQENAVKEDITIAKVEPAKTVANKPSVTNLPLPNTTKSACDTSKPATTTTKDDEKPNEMIVNVKTTNLEPSKATVKKATKSVNNPVANKPTTTHPAKLKKTASKPSKVDPPKVKEPTKITSKPFSNIQKKELKSKPAEIKKVDTKVTKNVYKTVKSYKDSAKSVRNSKDNKIEDDFDELNDYDILALLSSGIVLDECSESD